MYTSNQTQDSQNGNPWSKDIDELSKLLDEIPRATSAPPHLHDPRWANLHHPQDSIDPSQRSTPIEQPLGDIRFDEDYARFYEVYSGHRKLPPPIDNRTLYQDLPCLFQQHKSHQNSTQLLSHGAQNGLSSQQGHHLLARTCMHGLESINEHPVADGLQEQVLQALQQLSIRGTSPFPNGVHNGVSPIGSKPGTPSFEAIAAAAAAVSAVTANSPISQLMLQQQALLHSPSALEGLGFPGSLQAGLPIDPSSVLMQHISQQNNGISPLAAAAAQASFNRHLTSQSMAAGGQMPGMQMNTASNAMHNAAEYQAIYNAAYQAALVHTAQVASFPAGQSSLQAQIGGNLAAAAAAAQLGLQGSLYPSVTGLSGNHGNMRDGQRQGQSFGKERERNGERDRRQYDQGRGPRPHANGRDRDRERDKEKEHEAHRQHQASSLEDAAIAQFSAKFQSLTDVTGQLLSVAKDQNGCRYLQKKFDEGGASAIAVVFSEILLNAVELMTDPFGNYLIQKLLERCSEQQRLELLTRVAEGGELVKVALNTHGTRAIQKLVETLSSREQRAILIAALRDGVVPLIKDLNGNHVVQRCLQRLGPEDSQFIYDVACLHCVDVSSHRHGCCVVQRCIDHATPSQKHQLIQEISTQALVLSQDPFGNYVVQYVLELGHGEACSAIIASLSGHFAELSLQKFSSNVVEKCIKMSTREEERTTVVREMLDSPLLLRVLQDAYGNYVVQSALSVAGAPLRAAIVEAMRPHFTALRSTAHGKRILLKAGAGGSMDGRR